MKNLVRLLLPSFLVAAVFVLWTHFEPFSAPDPAHDGFLFELRVSAEKAGPARLFYDRGDGFRQLDSSIALVPVGTAQPCRFLIPPGWHRGVRLALGPGLAGLAIHEARVADLAGNERVRFSAAQFQPLTERDRVELRDGQAHIGRGAVLEFQPPLVLAPPIDWKESLWQMLAATALLALVLWKFEPRLNAGLAAVWRPLAARASARPVLTLFFVAAAATVVACHPVIFFGKSFVSPNNRAPCLSADFAPGPIEDPKGSDTGALLWAHLPYSVVQHRAIFEDHEWPLWNRFNTCGTPLLGQGQSMLGDPLHWLAITSGGASWAWDAKFVLSRLIFAFGIGLLVRAATGRLGVAVLLGASSVFIGFFSYRLNHPACFSLGYAPWILFAWWQMARAAGWRAAVPSALLLLAANWLELNSGTAKEAAMLIAGLNATGALVVFFTRPADRWRVLATGAPSLILFVLLSAPCWLVFLDALPRAYTVYGTPRTYQIQPALLLGLFDDLFYRQTAPSELHSNPAANFFVLLGVLWAMAAARRLRSDGGYRALLLAVLPPLALAFGVIPPAIVERLPFVRNISHVDNTFSVVLIVLLFPLAGLGLKACLERRSEAAWRREWLLAIALGAVLLAMFLGFTQTHARIAAMPSGAPEFPAKSPFFLGYAPALLAALAALPLALRPLVRGGVPAFGPLVVAALALAAMHFRQVMFVTTKFDAYVMNPQDRVALVAPSLAVEAVRPARRDGAEPGRVIGIRGVLAPGFNAALGLESPASADALLSPYWRELIEAAGMSLIWTWRLVATKENLPAHQPFFDLLNVRHYLATPGEPPPAPPSLKAFGKWDLEVLSSPTCWPRAFFTDALPRYRGVQDFAQLVRSGDGRPFAAVAESESAAPALPADATARQIVPATGYRLTSNSTQFVVEAPGPGVAVLGEAYEAGCFRVLLNGQPAPSFRANHLFQAVALPQAGRYVVRFTYRPPVWTTALALAGAGGALLLTALVILYATRPRASRSTSPSGGGGAA